MTGSAAERRKQAAAGPCSFCDVPRGEHEPRSLMLHTMQALGMTENESEQIWDRVLKRITA